MGWGERCVLHPGRFGVKVLPPGLQPEQGNEKPAEQRRRGGKGMEGTRIKLEVCGELGDFSILSDFGTCPLFLTLLTPKRGELTLFP